MFRYSAENEEVNIEDTILNHTKKMLGIPIDVEDFDTSIIANINVAFTNLYQLGVGHRSDPFMLVTGEETFSDFNSDLQRYSSVPMYIYLKTKLGFDPPTSGQLMDSIKAQISELEFRLNITDDTIDTFDLIE